MGMVGEACLPSNAYYPRTPDYTLCSGVHVCWSEHSDSSFVYGFMILDYGFGTMTATTYTFRHTSIHNTLMLPIFRREVKNSAKLVPLKENQFPLKHQSQQHQKQISFICEMQTFLLDCMGKQADQVFFIQTLSTFRILLKNNLLSWPYTDVTKYYWLPLKI